MLPSRLSLAMDEAAWSTHLLSEVLGFPVRLVVLSDCCSVVDKVAELLHVPTSAMLADGLTRQSSRCRDALSAAMSGLMLNRAKWQKPG